METPDDSSVMSGLRKSEGKTGKRLLAAGLTWLTAVAAFWFAWQVRDVWQHGEFGDFSLMYKAAQAAANRQPIYDIGGLRNYPFSALYNKPPLLASLLAPFAGMDFQHCVHLWLVACVVFYAIAFSLVVHTEGLSQGSIPFYLLAIGFLLFQPSVDTLGGPQLEFLLLLLLALAYWAARNVPERPAILGASIALASLLKLYPVLLLIYPLVRRSTKSVIWFIVGVLLLSLYSALVAGWEPQREFYLQVLPALSGASTAGLQNQSFFGFFVRLWVQGAAVQRGLATQLPLASRLSSAASLLVLAASVVTILTVPLAPYAFVILIPLGLLIAPEAWIHYETILLLPLGILLSRASKGWIPVIWIPLLLAFPLLAFGNEDLVRTSSSWVIQSYKFFGVYLVWLTGVVWAWRDRVSGEFRALSRGNASLAAAQDPKQDLQASQNRGKSKG